MKYVYIPLFARATYFTPQAEEFLSYLESQATKSHVKKWIKTTLRRHYQNKAPLPKITKEQLKMDNVPEYVKKDFNENDSLNEAYIADRKDLLKIDGESVEQLIAWIDKFYEKENFPSIQALLLKYRSFLEEEEKEKEKREEEKENPVVYRSGSFYFVELRTEDSIKEEGEIMQNCLGDSDCEWYPRIRSGRTKVFSLRDEYGKPHADRIFYWLS